MAREVTIVVVSASAFQEDCDECLAGGADGYIRKPYLEDDLLKEISRLMGVQYRYTQVEPMEDDGEMSFCISPSQMAHFESAIMGGDIDRTLDLIDEIEASRFAVKQLRSLALQFKYEELMDVIADADAPS